MAVYDSPQHVPQPPARYRPRPVEVDSDGVDLVGAGRPAETPEEHLLRDAMGPDLQAALDALPEAFREAVWLRDVEEFPYAEIAEMLGIPVGTVMSRISRGRRMLYDKMVGKDVEPARAKCRLKGSTNA